MLLRAITAFMAMPGIVGFALPIWAGTSAHHPMRGVPLAATVLALGTLLLIACVRHFGAEWEAYRANVLRWIGTRSDSA